jgi:hypothetical protein
MGDQLISKILGGKKGAGFQFTSRDARNNPSIPAALCQYLHSFLPPFPSP